MHRVERLFIHSALEIFPSSELSSLLSSMSQQMFLGYSINLISIAIALAVLSIIYLRYYLRSYIITSQRSTMISEHVVKLCCSPESVSSKLAQDPSLSPGTIIKELFGKRSSHEKRNSTGDDHASPEDLEKAFACGKWGTTRPSDLFLRASLIPIDDDHHTSEQSCLDIS